MIKLIGILVLAFVIACLVVRTRRKGHKLRAHRVRHMRMRIHCRMHPGHGMASGFELWLRWGRFAAFRESRRTRPGLGFWHRLTHPRAHSIYIGKAHHHRKVRITVQEHGALIGPPRSFKSALLSYVIIDAPGPTVATSSKADILTLTAPARAAKGPIWLFDPSGISGLPSNVRWSPVDAEATDPAVAIRRGSAFANATSTDGTEDAGYWKIEAGQHLQNLFGAAALGRQTMRRVGRWIGSASTTPEAVEILDAHGRDDWSAKLQELNSPAEKTTSTIRSVMSSSLSFLRDDALAASVLPAAPGEEFDIDRFLLPVPDDPMSGGTLYMLARSDDQDSSLAPLFAALAGEIRYRATQLAAVSPGHRLDPPLTMCLDEVTQICPVPLPSWLADSGGQGISIWTAFHGYAQLKARWRDAGAQTIIDTTNLKIVFPGLQDAETLKHLSQLCGEAAFTERGSDRMAWHDKLTPDMIRMLPLGFALLIRGAHSPVIVRVARGWKHPAYRKLKRRGLLTVAPAATQPAPVTAVAEPEPVPAAANGHKHATADDLATVLPGPWGSQ